MLLRQSRLSFQEDPSTSALTALPRIQTSLPKLEDTGSTISLDDGDDDDNDEDTIVVDTSAEKPQLPTPSESATEASSDSSQAVHVKIPKGKGRRVDQSKQSILKSPGGVLEPSPGTKSRSVSGETLVTSMSQSSLLQSGITALNLPWNMSSLFGNGSKGDAVAQRDKSSSTDSLDTVRNEEEEQARMRQAEAKKAKKEENARLRIEKWKAADEKATKKSSRVSMLGKASGVMSGLATSVLGKRSRAGPISHEDSSRPRSIIEPMSATTSAFDIHVGKRRRLSMTNIYDKFDKVGESVAKKKQILQPKNKRWLGSGLYAGQNRAFNPCLTETKNKHKETSKAEQPEKENSVIPLPMFAGDRLLRHGRDFKLPFDIFSPLPAGQPKPDEWRKTNKNVFVGDATDFWNLPKFQEYSTCVCKPEYGCNEDCINRFMYYECDEKNCNLTEAQCGNRAFEGLRQRVKKGGKYNVGVEVVRTLDRGNGVRSNRTFAPNQIIVEYTGEILTQEECESRMRTIYKDNACYYLMAFDQNMIIDATRGSIARFINHSCEPNCQMEKWTVGGKPRMALFAGERGIMTGEELTYDYNFDPYSQKNVQECRCGAKTCRGVLGPRPKDGGKPKADEEDQRENKLAGAKRKIAQGLDESSTKLSKKRKMTVVKAKVYSPSKASPLRGSKKVALVKKPAMRTMSISEAALSRTPSRLQRIIDSSREKSSRKRVTSGASGEALISRVKVQTFSRSRSVKEKAARFGKNVAWSMRRR